MEVSANNYTLNAHIKYTGQGSCTRHVHKGMNAITTGRSQEAFFTK